MLVFEWKVQKQINTELNTSLLKRVVCTLKIFEYLNKHEDSEFVTEKEMPFYESTRK